MELAAIIVAGGTGERFGGSGGKQLATLRGRPLLAWSVDLFTSISDIRAIVVVCPRERQEEYRAALGSAGDVVSFADSGPTRQDSVRSGLAMVPVGTDTVAIHDGARPLVRVETVCRAIRMLAETEADGIVVGHPAFDTLKQVDGNRIVDTPDRSLFWLAQTPQLFRLDALHEAHARATESGFVGTDDASLVERFGGQVLVCEGERDNLKVTVPEDIVIAEAIIAAREEAC